MQESQTSNKDQDNMEIENFKKTESPEDEGNTSPTEFIGETVADNQITDKQGEIRNISTCSSIETNTDANNDFSACASSDGTDEPETDSLLGSTKSNEARSEKTNKRTSVQDTDDEPEEPYSVKIRTQQYEKLSSVNPTERFSPKTTFPETPSKPPAGPAASLHPQPTNTHRNRRPGHCFQRKITSKMAILCVLVSVVSTAIITATFGYSAMTGECDKSTREYQSKQVVHDEYWQNFFREKSEPVCQFPFPADETTRMKCFLPSHGEYKVESIFEKKNKVGAVKLVCSSLNITNYYSLRCSDNHHDRCNIFCKGQCTTFYFSVNERSILLLDISSSCKQYIGHIVVTYREG